MQANDQADDLCRPCEAHDELGRGVEDGRAKYTSVHSLCRLQLNPQPCSCAHNVQAAAYTESEVIGELPPLDPYHNPLVMPLEEFARHPIAQELLHNGQTFQVGECVEACVGDGSRRHCLRGRVG